MGIIKYISTIVVCEQTWKSIYLTLTPPKKLPSTSLRDKSNLQILSSWTSNAQCATPLLPSTPTLSVLLYARTANTSSVCQKVEKESSASDPPGEERVTEHGPFLWCLKTFLSHNRKTSTSEEFATIQAF